MELLYNPRLLRERLAKLSCERLGELSLERRRLRALKGTAAAGLQTGHIDSLELLQLLRPLQPTVIFDVGANRGNWTLLAKALFPDAEIHAFEPLAVHHELFVRNTAGLDRVHLHKIALGNGSSLAEMHVTSFSEASSVLTLAASGVQQWNIHETGRETVPMERLDDYVLAAGLPEPSLIKLDVQGYELSVLTAAEQTLLKTNAVLTEVSFREFYDGQCLFYEVAAFLAVRGFELFAFGHGTAVGQPLVQADALFLTHAAAELC